MHKYGRCFLYNFASFHRQRRGNTAIFRHFSPDNFDKKGAKCSENEKTVSLRAIIF